MGCSPREGQEIKNQKFLHNRQQHITFDDAGRDRIPREAGGVVDVELLHKILSVLFDRLDADAEFVRRLLIRFALRDKLKHFDFARRQIYVSLSDMSGVIGPFPASENWMA